MTSDEIREIFLSFFESKGHRRVVSSPVIPWNDPTLLFTNAGMNQFKDVFLGNEKRDYVRATTCQKCIRAGGKHNDLDEVGHTPRHATFLEMLGNFSFGDYFKEGAAAFAWELLTEHYNFKPEELRISIYLDDDDAFRIWNEKIGVPAEKITRLGNIDEGDEENFWRMGDVGPCGPCSEIFVDLGSEKGCGKPDCGVACDCGRYLELWNLVFMQFNRSSDGSFTPLPAPSIDTGMGIERIAMVLQDKPNIFRTDVLGGIIGWVEDITGKQYDEKKGMAFRVVADHIRSLSFAIADGALPSNEGRGYVLRRILRRASRFGRDLDMHEPFLWKLVSQVVDLMGDAYPELVERAEHITLVVKGEEERFGKTLDQGIELFNEMTDRLRAEGKTMISGNDAFRLYDTYGFPLDLTMIMAEEQGIEVDTEGFECEMENQRNRARKASRFGAVEDEENWENTGIEAEEQFVGYDYDEAESRVLSWRKEEKERYNIIFERTPFYAESGGQISDTGTVRDSYGAWEANVEKVVNTNMGRMHRCLITKGSFPEKFTGNEFIILSIDTEKRRATEKNHTSTHLLHAALRSILGEHVRQSGSFVGPDRFRFDFNHYSALTGDEKRRVEEMVNRNILLNRQVKISTSTMEEAREKGATAIFEEKYGDKVRMVEIEGISLELCGGTHVKATGEIGLFQVLSESSAAAGIRRIEAYTGMKAYRGILELRNIIEETAEQLGCLPEQLLDRAVQLKKQVQNLEKELKKARSSSSRDQIGELIRNTFDVDGVRAVAGVVDEPDIESLRTMGDTLRSRIKSGVGVLGAKSDSKGVLICVVTDDLIKERGLQAGEIVKRIAETVGGGGGGKPHMAMAGCRKPEDVEKAIEAVETVLKKYISG